jgi:hypothetical protein
MVPKENDMNIQNDKSDEENNKIEMDSDDFFNSYRLEVNKKDCNLLEINQNMFNDYYKVNFDKIRFLSFNFYKEIFIQQKYEKISKMEEVLNDLKNQNYKTIKQKDINEKDKIKKFEGEIDDQKLLEKKISLAIKSKKTEKPIRILKLYSFICFCIMIILLIICMTFFHFSYSNIRKILNLMKNSVKIKYCDKMSVFFVGESTLLNFNADKIKGGTFDNFPSNLNDKKGYINLMREKLKESFFENQISLQEILSSNTILTKNTTKYLSETILNTNYIMCDGTIQIISADIFTTLMQYNGAFFNLATSLLDLEQNHTDIQNFYANSFNDYARGINILINLYSYDLEYQIN